MPDWILFLYIFAFGCCAGSFINVVVYRLPRDKSLIRPGSACPSCGEHIRFYDNIPLVSWLVLGRKCRYCKARISARYFVIELLAGSVFLGLFILYFRTDMRSGLPPFLSGGWWIYLVHIIMLGAFIAASAIDLESWTIPLSICWFVTGIGLGGSALGAYAVDPELLRKYFLLPSTSPIIFSNDIPVACLAVGGVIGLVISCLLLVTGVIKRSYEYTDSENSSGETDETAEEPQFDHRREILKEIVFLVPIIASALAVYWIGRRIPAIKSFDLSQHPVISGLLGSLWGYFVGCGIVWATRILGTLGFRKEAMGLGDVHLMGAGGAVIGPVLIVAAFFIAPFFGLAWACFQMFFRKTRQIPYGPFLSLGILVAIILHNRIFNYLVFMFY